MQFNPNMMSLNDLAQMPTMGNSAMSLYGSAISPEMQQQMMPMGMINRTGQEMMGQQQPMTQPDKGMSQGDMMKLAGMAMQGLNRGQQGIQAPTQQIMRDQNRFSYTQSPQQQMAQALRNRG